MFAADDGEGRLEFLCGDGMEDANDVDPDELGGLSKLEVDEEAVAILDEPVEEVGGRSRDSGRLCRVVAAAIVTDVVDVTDAATAAATASLADWLAISYDAFWYSDSYCCISALEMRNF